MRRSHSLSVRFNRRICFELKKIFTAIPYTATDTPSRDSEFTDYLYIIALTVLSFYDTQNNEFNRVRNIDIYYYLQYVNNIYNQNKFIDNDNIEHNLGYKMFKDLIKGLEPEPILPNNITFEIFNTKHLDKIRENFYKIGERINEKPIKIYLLKIISLLRTEFNLKKQQSFFTTALHNV